MTTRWPADSERLAATDDNVWGNINLGGSEAGFGGYLVNAGGCLGLEIDGTDGDPVSIGVLLSGLQPGLNGGMSADGTTLNYLGRDVTLGSLVEVGGGWKTLSGRDDETIAEFFDPIPESCLALGELFFRVNVIEVVELYPPGSEIDDPSTGQLVPSERPPNYGMLVPDDALGTLESIWSLANAGDAVSLSALASEHPGFEASWDGSDGSNALEIWIDEFGSERDFIEALQETLGTWPRPTRSGVRWGARGGPVWLEIGYDGTWIRASHLGDPAR